MRYPYESRLLTLSCVIRVRDIRTNVALSKRTYIFFPLIARVVLRDIVDKVTIRRKKTLYL